MKDRRLLTLQEKYSLVDNLKRHTKKVVCPICGGTNEAIETYPKSDCSLCGGLGFVIERGTKIIDNQNQIKQDRDNSK